MPKNTRRMPPPPHKPMTRDDFNSWREHFINGQALLAEFADIPGFIADVKRFNPKAGDLLEQLIDVEKKLAEALK